MKARTIRRRLNRERGGGRESWERRHWRPMKRYLRAHPETINGEVGRCEGFVLILHSELHPSDFESWRDSYVAGSSPTRL